MPNHVQAATEGLPSMNRRRALALTGTGFVTALAGACATVAHGKADPVAPAVDEIGNPKLRALIEAFEAARSNEDRAWKLASDINDAHMPNAPKVPGVVYGFMTNSDGERVSLYAATEEMINEVADQLDRHSSLMLPGARERNTGRRQRWLDELRQQRAEYIAWEARIGLTAAEAAGAEASSICCEIADELIAYPCTTFRDVQDIATLMVRVKNEGDLHLFGDDQRTEFVTSLARNAVLA